MTFSLACPDWERRILEGQSLVPKLPALWRERAARGLRVFKRLRLPDVIGMPNDVADRCHTTKQMGDAGEMLVAAELALHGVPAFTVPDFWPSCDVIAQPTQPGMKPQRISVKTRTYKRKDSFVWYDDIDEFDWLAVVILPGPGCDHRRFFILPREIADRRANPEDRRWKKDPRHRPGAVLFRAQAGQIPNGRAAGSRRL
jgi:hypothetical protein